MHQDQPDHFDWLSRLLSGVTYRAAVRPIRTLAVAGLITLLAIWLASGLEFRTSRLDLLSVSAGYNQRWLAFLDRFGKEDDAVIVVSHTQPARVSDALIALGGRLENDPRLSGVLYRKSVGKLADKALHLLPPEQLQRLFELLQGCLGIIDSSAPLAQPAGTQHAPSGWQHPLAVALTQAQAGLDSLQQSLPAQGPLLLEDDGKLGICLVRMPHVDDHPAVAKAQIGYITQHLNAIRTEFPDVWLGLTGMPILEWDESQSSQRDMQNATLLSLIGVAVIFVFGFGSWRMPCAAVVCLAIGLTWTLGLAELCIGHLNLFSIAFGAINAGLGIDYAIHLLSRLQTRNATDEARIGAEAVQQFESLSNTDQLPRALATAVAHCGKGIFTGAVTTAAAFAVAVLTPFRGMTELGLICALGTVSCMVVTIWVLPALIVWQAHYFPDRSARPSALKSPTWLASFHATGMQLLNLLNQATIRWRLPLLCASCIVTLLSLWHMPRLSYDHNLLNLQADDAPSVQAERELTSRSRQSAWFAVSMASSPQAAHALHVQLSKLPSVARVEQIGSVLNRDRVRTEPLVVACRDRAQQVLGKLASQEAGRLAAGRPPVDSLQMVVPASFSRAPGIDAQTVSQIQLLARSITGMSTAEPPTLSDFPDSVRSRMASLDGETYLLRIFARENLWERKNLGQFVKELESVDPRVTGHPIQTWYASGELENSYYQAGLYALLAVMALLMIDLGSVRLVGLALVPVGLSAIQLCGWLVAMNIPFNAANMIVLPLIIGIGIDDGVHILHDFASRGHKAFRLSSSTTLAVLLTSLTTMVGFGSMGIADHRGLQSLGIVLLIGVGLCLLNSWFTLPALLSYFGPSVERVPSIVPAASLQTTTPPQHDAPHQTSFLVRDVPILLSLPDYPELR